MKSIKCKLIRYREKFYVIFDDNRDIKIGDLVLTECLIPEGRVVNIFSDYENFGFYSVDNSPVKQGGAKSIIAASDNQIEKRFKDNYTGEKTCYLYEVDNNVLLNYDKTVVLTFDT